MHNNSHFDLLVFIGRFQPFHNSHYRVVDQALAHSSHVLILVGSANISRSPKNPFTAIERKVMIQSCFKDRQDRVQVKFLKDFSNDELWLSNVQDQVNDTVKAIFPDTAHPRIGIIGHSKDESSYYLHAFPQWPLLEVPNFQNRSATEIRSLLLDSSGKGTDMVLQSALPEPVFHFVQEFQRLPQYQHLVEEYQFIQKYRQQFRDCPYTPVFLTVDAVVVHSGHILLVERKASPGKGLLALPGGFLNPEERLFDSVVRELREETRLKIPAPVLKGSLVAQQVFDDPGRSQRGRTVTHAFYFRFPVGELPKVKGGDDAKSARWIPLSQFYALDGEMFEDHWHIVTHFIGDTSSSAHAF